MPNNRTNRDVDQGVNPPDHGKERQFRALEWMNEAECMRLISAGGVGRMAYTGRYGPTVLPVNYKLHEGAVVFRTTLGGSMDEDLRTGIADASYKVAFEIDDFNVVTREGWSVLIQGDAHHAEADDERASAEASGVEPWPSGERELFIRIVPTRVTGRRVRRTGG